MKLFLAKLYDYYQRMEGDGLKTIAHFITLNFCIFIYFLLRFILGKLQVHLPFNWMLFATFLTGVFLNNIVRSFLAKNNSLHKWSVDYKTMNYPLQLLYINTILVPSVLIFFFFLLYSILV